MGVARPEDDVLPTAALAFANVDAGGGAPYQEGWFGTGEARLHYIASGSGPTVVFVHGFPSFWYCWIRQLEALRGQYQVIAIDALGAGDSSQSGDDAAYSITRLAQGLGALIDHLAGPERVVLIGHDWGAALAFACAQRWPERFLGVAGLAAPPYNQFLRLVAQDADQQQRSAYMIAFRALTPARIADEGLARTIAAQAYAGLVDRGDITPAEWALFEAVVGQDRALWGGTAWYRANLPPFAGIGPQHFWPKGDPALQIPSLLIWGEADQTFVPSIADSFAAAHPGSEVLRLPGVGHWSMLQAAAPVNAALAGFIGRCADRESPAEESA